MSLVLITSLKGHQDRVWQVSWHPQGNRLASCSGDKTIRIYKFQGIWECTNTLEGIHQRTIRSICWSPDGRHLASASFDGTTAIWDIQDYECIATLEGHENEVKSCDFSCSGTLLATCSRDKSVWIWDQDEDDFACLSVLQEHSADVKMVKWHPMEEILASCSYDDTIRIWREDRNTDDWKCSDVLQGHTSTVWSIDFDGSGNYLVSVSDDKSLKIWRRYQPGNDQGVTTVRGEPKWKCLYTLENAHTRTIYSVSWKKVGKPLLATCGGDNVIKVWELQGEEHSPSLKPVCQAENAHGLSDVNCVVWSPGNTSSLASAGDDGLVKLWNFE